MTADPIGGVWHYALELARQFAARKVNLALATMGRPLRRHEQLSIRALPNVQLFESPYKLEWMADPWQDVAAAGRWLLDLASEVRPALVHLNQFCHGALPWKVPCLMVGHSCVYSWFEAVKGALPGAEWDAYHRAVQAGLRGADIVTAPSRWMLSALQRHYGPFAAAEPIYNGRVSARLRLAQKQACILTAGRLWDEAKNIASLEAIAARIPWPIYAAGESCSPDGNAHHLDGVIPLGQLGYQTLARWFARAAIFVLPARYEPFGLSALEAGLSGCALVLGDIPSLREIWRDAALFIRPDDPENVLSALGALIAEPSLRQDLAGRARKRALSFTPQRMAQRYLGLYEDLLIKRRQRISERLGHTAPLE